MSIESVMSSNQLILRCPLLLLPSIFWATVDELKAMSDAVDIEIVKDKLGESRAMPDNLEPGEDPSDSQDNKIPF